MLITKQLFLSIKSKVKFYLWYLKYALKLASFKNIHQGEDCFIIGNGPSLNKMDLAKLNQYYTFGLNKIYLIFERVDLSLSYYVTVNRLVIERCQNEIQNFRCPCFLEFTKSKDIIPFKENIYRLATTGRPYMFQTDITQKICEGNTVTYVAMQLAYYMGFKRVFLIGVDHNFKYSGNPNES